MINNVLLLKNKTTPRDPYEEKSIENSITPHFIPLLKHSPIDIQNTIEFLTSDSFIDNCDNFIITSQRAVEVFNECIEIINRSNFEIVDKILLKIGYTVGPATAKILKDNGFKDIRGGHDAGNGSILSDIIIKELTELGSIEETNSKPIIFFTGEIRKDIIPKKLKNNNIKIEEKVIYKTSERDDIIENFNYIKNQLNENSWIVFFSPQGTEIIVDYIREKQQELNNNNINGENKSFSIASIGPTTEEYLISKGIEPNVIAKKPEANSLLESIINYGSSLH